MNLYLVKILGIILVTMCCIIATYTDVKRQIIPNRLTFSMMIIGISLVSLYNLLTSQVNLSFYLSVPLVFIFSYFLWYLGIWAGGDVKLFTAISTFLIPEFLEVLPGYTLCGISFPLGLSSFSIPTFLLVFNSMIAVLPVIILILAYRIIKDKRYLINVLRESFNFKEVFLSLNSLIIAYTIISSINVHYTIIKLILLIGISYIVSKVMQYDILLAIFTVSIILQQLVTFNIFTYLEELIIITLLLFIKNILKEGIIKEAFTDNIDKYRLEEGMILAYPLCQSEERYYFDKTGRLSKIRKKLYSNEETKAIINVQACGLTVDEIRFITKIDYLKTVPLKKGLSFAPFILAGLFITFFVGNTYDLIILLLGLI